MLAFWQVIKRASNVGAFYRWCGNGSTLSGLPLRVTCQEHACGVGIRRPLGCRDKSKSSLLGEFDFICCDLHARLLPHEIHQYPNALLGINCLYRCKEGGKRSGGHLHSVSLA